MPWRALRSPVSGRCSRRRRSLRKRRQDGDKVDAPTTRSDIADYLGLTIEAISRTLTQLKQDGLFALPDGIRNRDQFEGLAAGEINTNI
jgi:CRP-like cAMP-binding protein